MTEDNPILNGPYEEPTRYYRTLPDGTLDYTKTKRGRRSFDPKINTPIPVRQGPQGQIFDQDEMQEGAEIAICLNRIMSALDPDIICCDAYHGHKHGHNVHDEFLSEDDRIQIRQGYEKVKY